MISTQVCRRPPGREAIDWADAVDDALPWRIIPGSAALDVDDNEDDIGPVLAFVGLAGLATVVLTAALLGGGEDMLPDARKASRAWKGACGRLLETVR